MDAEYLPERSIRSIFYYEHRQDNRCVIGVFNVAASKALIAIVDKAGKLESVPNVGILYGAEKARL